MSDLLTKIKHSEEKKKKKKTSVSQTDLQKLGLTGITLRPYQLDGVQWLSECQRKQQGCILGDEMGLGKTCQTISLLVFMSGSLGQSGPFLVLSPLSVMENWRNELQRYIHLIRYKYQNHFE
ncbi:chromodomain-helicase-DNA-binding protein 1-like [Notothenia coriiceps]|uniref:Chromodomain-helicase-DNA-binding protein 1-like n=1 Tax=Notothenia coriiceps TaxID=8208 RepID=A0A6I9NE20_9TELE|nr:PREDICTED: chromodomain-helicase-DNA-binding protein 1-like [Notothenia coriiceps]